MPTLTLLFNRVLEIFAREIGKEKEIKDFQTGKEEKIKLLFFFFFFFQIIFFFFFFFLYVRLYDLTYRKSQRLHKTLLELVKNFNRVSGYKIIM